jgi:hypothetical protein
MGIFRRSFVRAYAQAIGLDPDAVLKEFLELYPDPVEEDVPAILAAARERRRPPTRLGYLISTAISALPAVRVPGARLRSARGLMSGADTSLADLAGEGLAEDSTRLVTADGIEPNADSTTSPAAAPYTGHVDHGHHEFGVVETGDLAACEPDVPVLAVCRDEIDEPAPRQAPLFEDPLAHGPAGDRHEMSAFADLCTRLAVAVHPREVAPILEEAAGVLRAAGLTLWVWEHPTRTLRHVLAYGYPGDVASRLPRVRYDADNAIADAFRSSGTQVVRNCGAATGALVVPIMAPGGCAGVLALEFQDGGEERETVRALTTILAAQLATLFGYAPMAEAVCA